ncbi:MAG: sulfurtransferase TusA family protein [Pseudomonadota bacterium]
MDWIPSAEVDACGLPCPLPLLRAKKGLAELVAGEVLCVRATDPAAPRDFAAYADATGHVLERVEEVEGVFLLYLRKREA